MLCRAAVACESSFGVPHEGGLEIVERLVGLVHTTERVQGFAPDICAVSVRSSFKPSRGLEDVGRNVVRRRVEPAEFLYRASHDVVRPTTMRGRLIDRQAGRIGWQAKQK